MSEQKKLHLHVVKKDEEEYELVAVSLDKNVWFLVPQESSNITLHQELMTCKSVISSKNSIKNIGGYRKIAIALTPELQKTYLDEDGSFHINDYYLEELAQDDYNKVNSSEIVLMNRIRELEQRKINENKINLSEIEYKFLIRKFDGKQNAITWMDQFEKECNRYNINETTLKVEVSKLFLDRKVKEWYDANLIKLSCLD